jgi:transposase-like protein
MTERAKYWSGLVAAWSRSGLSQAEFCRRRGVNGGTFIWWKRQLEKAAGPATARSAVTSDAPKRRGRPPKAASARFVEVRLPGASALPTYEVVLARGRSIRVPSQFDPRILSQLITAVESC